MPHDSYLKNLQEGNMLTETNNNEVEDIEIIENFHMLKYSHKSFGG